MATTRSNTSIPTPSATPFHKVGFLRGSIRVKVKELMFILFANRPSVLVYIECARSPILPNKKGGSLGPAFGLSICVLYISRSFNIQRVIFDELAPRFHVFTHQRGKEDHGPQCLPR